MKVIAFALPQESRELVAMLCEPQWSGSRRLPVVTGRLGAEAVVVLHTGMGAASAREALALFWQRHGPDGIEAVIGAGFAGGLDPSLAVAALVLWGEPQWLVCARATLGTRARVGALSSAPEPLETPQAKAQWARTTGAIAVDMETETVAAFCREKGVPFLALRAISDTAGDALPVPLEAWFDLRAQRPRPVRLIGFLLRHPGRIAPFARLVGNVGRARRALTQALVELSTLPCPAAANGPARSRR